MRYVILPIVLGACMLTVSCGNSKNQDNMTFDQFSEIVAKDISSAADVAQLFAKSVKEIEVRATHAKDDVTRGLAKLYAIEPQKRTFNNTVRALDTLFAQLHKSAAMIYLLQMVSPDKQIRETAQRVSVDLGKFEVDAFQDQKLFQAFKDYRDYAGKTEKLATHQKYLFDESMEEFKRAGLDLPLEKQAEIKDIKKHLSDICMQFGVNIAKDNATILVTGDELDGVDEHMIKNLKRKGDKYVLGVDYPTFFEVIKNCTVSSTREKLFLAYQNRAYPENVEVLEDIINLRDQLAHKLGYESFAALNIDPQMAKTPQEAERFLKDLIVKASDKADKEFKLFLSELPDGVEFAADNKIKPWDYYYILESYKKKHFNIDERKIAEYFPVGKTIKGLFAIYEKFLGLKFKEIDSVWKWHDDVQLLEIHDAATNKLCGYIYLDLYPRENKYNHACHLTLAYGQDMPDGRKVPSVAAVIANFPKATKDRPALLKHADVETFFHEFGHAMHGVVASTELSSHSGTNVKHDFVEMPSQMFEEWMWDKDMLAKVSGHYQTGKSLPKEIIDKKVALKKINSGYFVQRQCWLSLFSLNIYKKGAQKDTTAIAHALHDKYFKQLMFDERTHFHASFGHLSGYAARYYGYMWSKVFALDIFETIMNRGLDKASTGKEFVDKILSKGGSQHPSELLEDYLGRKPSIDAFLKDQGFI
jgi:thimet oligopeptidase